ncbi:MAG: hypothetical protein ACP5T6_03745 [Candidatus Micrarchaeia archaeon]
MHTKIISRFSSTDNHCIGELSQFPNTMYQTYCNMPNLAIVVDTNKKETFVAKKYRRIFESKYT